jgi:hypothetical protein
MRRARPGYCIDATFWIAAVRRYLGARPDPVPIGAIQVDFGAAGKIRQKFGPLCRPLIGRLNDHATSSTIARVAR